MFDSFTDSSFHLEKTNEYILSIQVSLDGFSFLVMRANDKKILAFEYFPVKISSYILISRHFSEWINSRSILQKIFQKIYVVVFSNEFYFLPESFHREELKKKIPGLFFEKNDDLELAENFVEKLKARLIFALPVGLNELIHNFFGACEIVHPAKPILNNFSGSEKEYTLVLLFETKNLYAFLFHQNQVLLANNFKIAHINDVIYFTLNTLQQLKVAPVETEVLMIGANNDVSDFTTALQPYFENMGKLQPEPEIMDMAAHSFLRYFSSL